MADQKVSNLPALNGADVDSADLLYIVDSSAGTAGSKKITIGQYQLAPYSAATANTVVYFNGTKVPTSSSALTFDGTNLGVGTASPTNLLTLGGSTGGVDFLGWNNDRIVLRQYFDASYYQRIVFDAANRDFRIQSNSGDSTAKITFWTGASGTVTENMRLDASGNLGIGTSSPATKLEVSGAFGTSTTGITLTNSTGFSASNIARFDFKLNNSFGGSERVAAIWALNPNASANNGGALVFGTSANGTATTPTEGMRLDASGNLGLGVTPNGSYKLEVNGGGLLTGLNVSTGGANNTANTATFDTSGAGAARFYSRGANASTVGSFQWRLQSSNGSIDTQAMTLDASGNIALGQTSAAYRLDVLSGADVAIRARTSNSNEVLRVESTGTTNAAIRFINTAANAVYIGSDSGALNFLTNNTERARITSGGDLLLGLTGTTFNGTRAEVLAGTNQNGVGAKVTQAAYTPLMAWNSSTTGDCSFMYFYTEATITARGSIDYDRAGGLTRYNTTSDYRAKDIIGPVQNPGATIDALKVYEGVMKGATRSRPMLVAHEAQAVAPYAVSGVKDEVNEDGSPKFQQMDVSSLVPLLIAEIQSLRARVAALEAK